MSIVCLLHLIVQSLPSLIGLAFITYLGIFLFGYDTGIAGGVVSNPFFLSEFGLIDANGKTDVAKSNAVSSNVVSVLQAGAFFGALGSAPVSAKIGRRYTLLIFVVVLLAGAVSIALTISSV